MLITINDLKLGNIVKHFDKHVEIKSIYNWMVNIKVDDDKKIVYGIPVQELEPIKINSDALEKMGFNQHPKKHNRWVYKDTRGQFTVNKINGRYCLQINDACKEDCPAVYVHQLQNLIYSWNRTHIPYKWREDVIDVEF